MPRIVSPGFRSALNTPWLAWLPEFGWTTSGAYLSTRSLGEADRRLPKQALVDAARHHGLTEVIVELLFGIGVAGVEFAMTVMRHFGLRFGPDLFRAAYRPSTRFSACPS